MSIIIGDDGANALAGGAGADLIYGFDPGGPLSDTGSIAATRVAAGLVQPLYVAAPPGDLERLFIVEKNGLIRILDLDTQQVLATPFLDLTGQVATDGEMGLLGLAFHPDFASNGYFYVNVVNLAGDTEIRRYQVSAADPNRADATSSTLIITVDQPDFTNHKGGWLGFGPDGNLYAALGDGGSGGDPFQNAQNPDSLLGKMLRLDVDADDFPADAARNYAIPEGNLFAGADGADEIWALGLRNPWRASFDRALGDFYIADVGQGEWEEVNLGQAGANYGWDIYEGPDEFEPGTPFGGGTLTAPVHYYTDGDPNGQSITGGYVYRGPAEGLHGRYFFADFIDGKVFTLQFDGAAWVAIERTAQITADAGTIGLPASFGEDGYGNLYVVDYGGEIFRLTPGSNSTDQSDSLAGLAGDDFLFGGSGDDTLDGGADDDELQGGAGADTLAGGTGTDKLIGADGNDTLVGGDGSGTDTLDAGDTLAGGAGNDSLAGGFGADRALGGEGNDTLIGNAGNDLLSGGTGNDVMFGRIDNDNVLGGPGSDNLQGNAGDDTLTGNTGNDSLNGGAGNDVMFGSADNDNVLGGIGNDNIQGNAGNDTLIGGDGTGLDTLDSGDTLDGGPGNDSLAGGYGADNLLAGDGNDTLTGNAGNDTLSGGTGNDGLFGNAGADVLAGGAGNDTMQGNADSDSFRYDAAMLNTGDVAANQADLITAAAGEIISMLGLIDELTIGGTALSALTADAAVGNVLNATNNIAFTGGVLQIDLDGNDMFNGLNDFQVQLTGLTSVTYNATNDLFHLA